MTSSEYNELDADDKMLALLHEAAPLIAVAALQGGSLFYKQWLDRALEFGIEVANSTTHPAQEGEGTHGELE